MDIDQIGQALYGDNWRAPLAKKLGVNERTVRRWADGEFKINESIWSDIMNIVNDRQQALEKAREFVEKQSANFEEQRRPFATDEAHLAIERVAFELRHTPVDLDLNEGDINQCLNTICGHKVWINRCNIRLARAWETPNVGAEYHQLLRDSYAAYKTRFEVKINGKRKSEE